MLKSGRNFSCGPTKSQIQDQAVRGTVVGGEREWRARTHIVFIVFVIVGRISFEHHLLLHTATKLKRETPRQSLPASGRVTIQPNNRWWVGSLWHVAGAHLRRNWHCPLVAREQEMKAMLSVVIKVNLASTANWLTGQLTTRSHQ